MGANHCLPEQDLKDAAGFAKAYLQAALRNEADFESKDTIARAYRIQDAAYQHYIESRESSMQD